MGTSEPRRVLVAASPVVLEGALALLLEEQGRSQVVQFHDAPSAQRAVRYDLAVVTEEHAADVDADLVVTLPDGRPGDVIDLLERRLGVHRAP
ncbi:MAG TPA: hypothetical protein VFJ85_11000 [Acidimicrobiales bacterium]|nr:hypothetical protein [Acidimicrobiales bacterium]